MIDFAKSERSTLGLEWELQLIDQDTLDLRQCAETVLTQVNEKYPGQSRMTKEMLLNTVEINSSPRHRVSQCLQDMREGVEMLQPILAPMRVRLATAGSHPFANPKYQRVTDSQRYAELVERTQYWGRQMLLFGTHVHVGIEDKNKVLPILKFLLTKLGTMQALMASSPFWAGVDTGYCDNRAMVFQQLPTAGIPRQFDDWLQLEVYVSDVTKTGIIDTFDEVRWDIRPSPKFGTLEIRVADAATNLVEVGAFTALVQCLVEWASRELDAGRRLAALQPWLVGENKWRAARYGMDAILIEDSNCTEQTIPETLPALLATLEPVADDLSCLDELMSWEGIVKGGVGYQRQRQIQALHSNLESVVELMCQEFDADRPLDPKSIKTAFKGDRNPGAKESKWS